jgi:hypothetical protein
MNKPSLDYLMGLSSWQRLHAMMAAGVRPEDYGESRRSMGINPRALGTNPRSKARIEKWRKRKRREPTK